MRFNKNAPFSTRIYIYLFIYFCQYHTVVVMIHIMRNMKKTLENVFYLKYSTINSRNEEINKLKMRIFEIGWAEAFELF